MIFWASLGLLAVFLAFELSKRLLPKRGRPRRDTVTLEDGSRHEKKPAAPPTVEALDDFKWDETKPLAFRPFKPIYHITMGVQSSSPSELITIDHDYKEKIKYRRATLSAHAETAMGSVPEGLIPAQELYTHLLIDHLPVRFPTMFTHDATTRAFTNLVTGRTCSTIPPDNTDDIFRTLGEHVEDDLFLLEATPDGHRMVSYVCCHPNGFDPAAKLGKLMKDIHTSVPAYEKIGPSMERFFAKLETGQVVKRLNWGVTTALELFTPRTNHFYDGDEVTEDEEVVAEKARLRVELQSLSRLPRTKAILFSFKSYLYPLSDIKEEGLGPQLADAIEGLKKGNAEGMWVYKGAVRWGKSVCRYLRC